MTTLTITGEQFRKVENKDFPGDFSYCTRCSETFEGDTAMHVCPPPPAQVLTQDQLNRKSQELTLAQLQRRWLEWDTLSAEERGDAPDRATAIHRYEEYEKYLWDNELQRIERQFSPTLLHKLAMEESKFLIQRTKEMRELEYTLNDERRSQGFPYEQRMKLIDRSKITWCDKEEALLTKSFRVKPLREWFTQVDFWLARELGMRWVIRSKFYEIIYG